MGLDCKLGLQSNWLWQWPKWNRACRPSPNWKKPLSEACDIPTTPADDIDCLNSITMRAPLPPLAMSTTLYNLWSGNTYTKCRNRKLSNLLQTDRHLFYSATHAILSHITSNKTMKKYNFLSSGLGASIPRSVCLSVFKKKLMGALAQNQWPN